MMSRGSRTRFLVLGWTAIAASWAGAESVRAGEGRGRLLERTLAAALEDHGFPAAAAAIVTSGDVQVAALGKRRIDRPEQVTLDDHFGIGSNAKAFTASMLGALVERGLLRWEVTLGEALPDLPMRDEYRQVSLRQLLTHRGGLQPWASPEAFARAQAMNRGDFAAARLALALVVLSEEPIAAPGTTTRYSNVDFTLATMLAERATGETWQELITRYVSRPLGIAPRFLAPGRDEAQPWGHSRASGSLVPIEPIASGPGMMQGAGGIAISIRDYAAFLQAHLRGLRGEDTPLLKAATVRELHRPEGRYALGWGIQEYAGHTSSIHAGGDGKFYALMVIQPERDRAVAFLTNDGGDDVETQASALLKTLLAAPPDP